MPLLRTDREIAEIYERHADMVFRICFSYLKDREDTRDAVSDTFLRLIKAAPAFESGEHEKAWLIRTAANVCKNALKHWWRRTERVDDYAHLQAAPPPETGGVWDAVLCLPDRYKAAVYLYYYEGYDSGEISAILKKPGSTIRNYLSEARKRLKEMTGGDFT